MNQPPRFTTLEYEPPKINKINQIYCLEKQLMKIDFADINCFQNSLKCFGERSELCMFFEKFFQKRPEDIDRHCTFFLLPEKEP